MGLRQHIRRKHQISQVDGTDEVDPEADNKPKENISDDMVKEKETSIETIYELNLDEIQIHIGHGTPQLS